MNRRINLAERNRNLSHVKKTCLFMNIIKAIIFLEPTHGAKNGSTRSKVAKKKHQM